VKIRAFGIVRVERAGRDGGSPLKDREHAGQYEECAQCDGGQAADAGKPRYCDDNLLTETGNRRLVPLFATAVGNALPGVATDSKPIIKMHLALIQSA